MLAKTSNHEKFLKKSMATEELKNTNPILKFQSLLDKDFKDRKLKETDYKSYSN